jgi:hypothetical protein
MFIEQNGKTSSVNGAKEKEKRKKNKAHLFLLRQARSKAKRHDFLHTLDSPDSPNLVPWNDDPTNIAQQLHTLSNTTKIPTKVEISCSKNNC